MSAVTIARIEKRRNGSIVAHLSDGSSCEWSSVETMQRKASLATHEWDRTLYAALGEILRDDPKLERPENHTYIRAESFITVRRL